MHFRKVALRAWLAVMAVSCWSPARSEITPPDPSKGYPGDIAVDDEGDKGVLLRRFPGAQRLYIYDLDKNNQSVCNLGCDGPRPPVYADCSAAALPDWTVIHRYNGRCQWSYKGHPLYTYFHDTPESPKGDGEGGVWHVLGYLK